MSAGRRGPRDNADHWERITERALTALALTLLFALYSIGKGHAYYLAVWFACLGAAALLLCIGGLRMFVLVRDRVAGGSDVLISLVCLWLLLRM